MWQSIFADIRAAFGFDIYDSAPVLGGWLNEKRKIVTDVGVYLVKQFSEKRYGKGKMTFLEAALQCACRAYAAGVPSPKMLSTDGHVIHTTKEGYSYTVMTFCEGEQKSHETITLAGMQSLGAALGQLHTVYAGLKMCGVHQGSTGQKVYDMLRTHTEWLYAEPEYANLLPFIEKRIAEVTPQLLDALPRQICHEDFSADNLLFSEDRLSAILDFDRTQYSFPLHDVGRALMSFAFDEERLRPEYIRAFCQGYAVHRSLTEVDVVWALRLVFCMEMSWWFLPGYGSSASPKVQRFFREVCYLAKYGGVLAAIVHEAFYE